MLRLDRTARSAVGWLEPRRTTPERIALFAAAAAVGPSFEPGLRPRRPVDQVLATGVVSAAALSLVTTSQSMVEALAHVVLRSRRMPKDGPGQAAVLAFAVGANAAAAAGSAAVARALPPREDESVRRGLLRVAAQRTSRVTAAGALLAGGVAGVRAVAVVAPRLRVLQTVPVALTAGIAAAAYEVARVRRDADRAGDTSAGSLTPVQAVASGLGVVGGVVVLQAAETGLSRRVGAAVAGVWPRYDADANPVGHAVTLAVGAGTLVAGYQVALRVVERVAARSEPEPAAAPSSPLVSGGPGSTVSFDSLSREGRRFTAMVLRGEAIRDVMQEEAKAEPIRLFVGLGTTTELEDRVDTLMDELTRTGAFDRDLLVFASPTGSGYVNYVAAEAIEYLSRGSSAIVALQYSTLPSWLALNRTALAVEQNRALMHAVTGYLRGMPPAHRPRFVVFGESLGAQTMQDVWRHRTTEAIHRDYVDSAIFLGTPAGAEFARSWRTAPHRVDPAVEIVEVDSFEQYAELPAAVRECCRYVLVTHHDDPVPKFGSDLLLRRPTWLGPPGSRPHGIPRSTRWRPGTTYLLTAVDLLHALEVTPGVFGRAGHDYRADIARFVSSVYRLPATPAQLDRVEVALREREARWAQRRRASASSARQDRSARDAPDAWGRV